MTRTDAQDPEFDLLATATARSSEPYRATLHGIDWFRFLRLIDRHRIAALAFDGLKDCRESIPDDVYFALRNSAMRDRAEALHLVGVLAVVSRRLAEAGIEAVSLKGPTLAMIAFGDASLRQSKDLDVLILLNQVDSALRVLHDAGFELIEPQGPWAARDRSVWIRMVKDVVLRHALTGVVLELHWRLNNNDRLHEVEERLVQQVSLRGHVFSTLRREDLVTYLCVHGASHSWFRLKWLADVHALLSEGGRDGIERFYRYSAARGLEVPAAGMLLLLKRIYGLDLPGRVSDRARKSWRGQALYRASLILLRRVEETDERGLHIRLLGLTRILIHLNPWYILREIEVAVVNRPIAERANTIASAYLSAALQRPVSWIRRHLR